MKIETKFDVGDNIFYTRFSEPISIKNVKICNIIINNIISDNIRYILSDDTEITESRAFSTAQEVIDSLYRDENKRHIETLEEIKKEGEKYGL